MVNENLKPIIENKKPTETVYEIKKSLLSPAARDKVINKSGSNFLSDKENYGPCRNSDCDCYCSSYDCICSSYTKYGGSVESGRSIKINKKTKIKGFQHLIHTGNDWADKNDAPTRTARSELWDGSVSAYDNDGRLQIAGITTSAGTNVGIGGAIASGGVDYSTLRIGDDSNEIKFLGASVGGEIGAGPGGVVAGYSLGADAVSVRAGGFQANAGIDAGSGVSFGAGGVEAKVAGVGFSVGKKMGISTPIGGVSVDLEEACVVQ